MKSKLRVIMKAPVIFGFVAMCLIVMILNHITDGYSNVVAFMTYHSPLDSVMTYVRFFTHVLGHAGGEHFIMNMAYLLLIGPPLEEKYGSLKIAALMAITALVTGVINYIFFWDVAIYGASGICFALIVLAAFTRYLDGEIPTTFILIVIFFLGQEVYEGMFVENDISNMAHVAGGIVGAILGAYEVRKKKNLLEEMHE